MASDSREDLVQQMGAFREAMLEAYKANNIPLAQFHLGMLNHAMLNLVLGDMKTMMERLDKLETQQADTYALVDMLEAKLDNQDPKP